MAGLLTDYKGQLGNGAGGLLADWLFGLRRPDVMNATRLQDEYMRHQQQRQKAMQLLQGNEQVNPVNTSPALYDKPPGAATLDEFKKNYQNPNAGPATTGAQGLLSRVDPDMRPFIEGLASIDPLAAMSAAMPKPPEEFTLGANQARYRGNSEIARNTVTDFNKPFLADGSPNPAFQEYDLRRANAGRAQTFITNDMRQERAYSTARGGQFAKLAEDVDVAAQNAASGLSTMAEMSRVLSAPGVYQGSNQEAINSAKKFASTVLGMDMKGVPETDVARSIGNQLALEMKKDTKDPQMSASELIFYQAIPPNLGNSPGGNQLLIEIRNRKYKRDLAIAKAARDYEAQHGQLDAGFVQKRAEIMQKNPVNTPDMEQRMRALKPTASSDDPELDALLKKYGGQ